MRYRFCSSCTEEMDRQLREDQTEYAEMQGYNCIMIYSPDKSRLLFCKRLEETGIRRSDVALFHMMDFTYFNQNCTVEVYAGVLTGEAELVSEKHPLCWIDAGEDFFDLERFAGEGNIGHMVEQVRDYGMGVPEK